jgi:hypothetical protein
MIRLRDILNWWIGLKPSLNPLATLQAWEAADRREKRARLRRDTKAIHRARAAKYEAVHANMRGAV